MTDEQIIQKAREAGMTGEATPAVIEFVRNLLEAEIEACAKVAETISDKYGWGHYGNEVDTADEIAAAIRARENNND